MKLRKIISFVISSLMLQGCATARSDDVGRAAANYLHGQFHQEFTVLETKSTLNEGNMNFRGFRITAAPKNEPRAVYSFNADYAKGRLSPTGLTPEKALKYALERVTRSEQLVTALDKELTDFRAALIPPLLYGKATIDIQIFSVLDNAHKAALFQRLANALKAAFRGLDYKEIAVQIAFYSPERLKPSADRFIPHYFTHDPDARLKSRGNIYGLLISGLTPAHPPDARALQNALHVNSSASRIQGARGKSQRWLQAYLKKALGRPFRVELNKRTAEITDSLNRIAFEFAACDDKKRHPRHCPEERRLIHSVIYDLESGEMFPSSPEDNHGS